MLRSYLARNHAWRQARLETVERGLVHDRFLNTREGFGYNGWQNWTTLLEPEKVRTVEWPNVRPGRALLFYGCGPGGGSSIRFFGNADTLAKTPLEAVFTMLFGSGLHAWNGKNNLMRAALAHERGALTCGWGGRPHWYLHSMGMGETIGDGLRRTQNNDGDDYQPTGSYVRGVHIALMGDPTLRLHRVAPPSDLRVQGVDGGVRLSWAASSQKVVGYHVYRAQGEFDPYERLTERPVVALSFVDGGGTQKHYYQVRAVVLQESTTGTYYNSSQGVFAGPVPRVTPNGWRGVRSAP
jgi:hypothetical protein